MKGYITIDPTSGPTKACVQIRAHCRATSLKECNRTLLYNVHPHQVASTRAQCEVSLADAGCSEYVTNDLREDNHASLPMFQSFTTYKAAEEHAERKLKVYPVGRAFIHFDTIAKRFRVDSKQINNDSLVYLEEVKLYA